jgi:dephospho-CoA kinase
MNPMTELKDPENSAALARLLFSGAGKRAELSRLEHPLQDANSL